MGDTVKRAAMAAGTMGMSEAGGLRTLADPSGGGKKTAPAPPDFSKLAGDQTAANRPNQSTPFASTTWDPTHTTQTTSASPELQGLISGNEGLAKQFQGQAADAWSKPLDNGAQARDSAENAIYGRETARLDPMWKQREQDTNASLANQGLDPSSEAGGKALDVMNRGRNDAYSSALQDAIMGGGQEASRQQAMDLNARAAPLSALSSATGDLSGLKGLMGMPGYGQAGDLLGAGGMQFGANMQDFNANGGPLGGYGQLLQALGPLLKAAAANGGGG